MTVKRRVNLTQMFGLSMASEKQVLTLKFMTNMYRSLAIKITQTLK